MDDYRETETEHSRKIKQDISEKENKPTEYQKQQAEEESVKKAFKERKTKKVQKKL